ncbi:hydroxymethylbilane synthase [Rhodocaloribacter litoris]|uniref:hydroxymethylbilane synthase n=1 Tax=Rhodocaloribacter litoris TaxID=2558931 RepID=UPI00141ED465|nr:hydroxymethylbilane synthase [Rhodocaloribacter litoris]QXD15682.1 hydroxymethylbilane synthase [Rhodocaloribacter litoris]GIV61617.1 MAG: porphobilinogen deaminase [Rhodothermaceae bacterium]
MTPATLTAGTRGSRLARRQTRLVLDALRAAWPGLRCEERLFSTRGDRLLEIPLPRIGGKGLFTEELEAALRAGEIDLAVHSLKDLPVDPAPGLVIGAVPRRGPVQDVLVAASPRTLETLPPRAVVGTSSPRRAAQLRHARPDLDVRPLRGNVDTRLARVQRGDYDAAVMAAAGFERLELEAATVPLPFDVMLPAPGQGALAVQCRLDDEHTRTLLAALDDATTRRATTAERSFLHALGGGCAVPVAACAEVENGNTLRLTGLVAAPDGSRVIRRSLTGTDPEALGHALADLLLTAGADALLSHA